MSEIKSIGKKTFTSNINRDDGRVSVSEGTHESTMELYQYPKGGYSIEWIIDSLDEVKQIGIEVEGKEVTGYDGVFELPLQAIELLEEHGFDCTEMRVSMELPAKPTHEYTPDEWKELKPIPGTHRIPIINAAKLCLIAEVVREGDGEANAKLIAAAPELLAACSSLEKKYCFAHVQDVPTMIEKAANLLEIKCTNDKILESHSKTIEALLFIANNLRSAIKKATA